LIIPVEKDRVGIARRYRKNILKSPISSGGRILTNTIGSSVLRIDTELESSDTGQCGRAFWESALVEISDSEVPD
jgi:hypothetical protein